MKLFLCMPIIACLDANIKDNHHLIYILSRRVKILKHLAALLALGVLDITRGKDYSLRCTVSSLSGIPAAHISSIRRLMTSAAEFNFDLIAQAPITGGIQKPGSISSS